MANKPMVSFEIRGGKEIEQALKEMEQKAARNVVTRTVRASMVPVLKELRERVKSDLHTMNAKARAQYAKQIGISIDRKRSGAVVAKIRTKSVKLTSASSPGKLINYSPLAHLFEGGTRPHKIKQKNRTIDHPGVPDRPVWAKTFDEKAQSTTSLFMETMWKNIKKEWDKVPKKK